MEKPISIEIKCLSNLIMRYMEQAPHTKEIQNLTGTNEWVIGFIADNIDKDIFQKDLEEQFCITRSTASRIVNLMVKKNLIYHKSSLKDARLKKLCLTDNALEIYKTMKKEGDQMESKLLKGFSEKEICDLRHYVKRMQNNIKL